MQKSQDVRMARIPVGIWAQWPDGARWSNEGMTRLLGFLIEGIAQSQNYVFRVVLPNSIRQAAEQDLATLRATAGLDYTVHSPADAGLGAQGIEALAKFADAHVDVVGWLSIFPTFTAAKYLLKPVTTIFPDAIPSVFHEFSETAWGPNGNHVVWRDYVTEMLSGVARVVTFSDHVAETQAHGLFGVPRHKIRVVPHASPDLKDDLPFVENRKKTPASVARAADMLRTYCRERGVAYFYDFPFESVPYIAVSTQDRVTKNLVSVALALEQMVRRDRISMKVITTAPLHFGANWTPLPGMLEANQSQFDFLSIPDLPRDVHAAFYHCATVAVHPSFFEGGHAPFPFYEAVSVGTPCIVARGPHVLEICEKYPALADFTFDPSDHHAMTMLIKEIAAKPEKAIRAQGALYKKMSSRSWGAVATGYAMAATEHLNSRSDV